MAEKKKDVTESTEIVVVEVTEELLREKLYDIVNNGWHIFLKQSGTYATS